MGEWVNGWMDGYGVFLTISIAMNSNEGCKCKSCDRLQIQTM
ncbi:hypothetical protein [Chamaesiphon minutus]|nr:hypothetical protein [Chamaesiphon minutus]